MPCPSHPAARNRPGAAPHTPRHLAQAARTAPPRFVHGPGFRRAGRSGPVRTGGRFASPGTTPTRPARCPRRAHRRRAHGQRGFTLIEIMVVVVILGILASLVVPRVMSRPDEARQVTARQDVKSIAAALALYRLDNYTYPSSAQGLAALVQAPAGDPPAPNWKGPYLERVPNDPWQRPYLYLSPGAHGEVDVYSLGADGAPGGEGANADIGNWQG